MAIYKKLNSTAKINHGIHFSKNIYLVLAGFGILGFIFGTYLLISSKASAEHQLIGVPAYFYPSAEWDKMAVNAGSVGYVIMNPSSGVGPAVDPSYTAKLAANKAAGISTLGNVATGYFTNPARTSNSIAAEISTYKQQYPSLDGIFFDEVNNSVDPSNIAMLNALAEASKRVGFRICALNFGAGFNPAHGGICNLDVTFENTAAEYLKWQLPQDGWQNNPANSPNIWHIIHTTAPDQIDQILKKTKENNAGVIFVTDASGDWQSGVNTFGSLGAYFDKMLTFINTNVDPPPPIKIEDPVQTTSPLPEPTQPQAATPPPTPPPVPAQQSTPSTSIGAILKFPSSTNQSQTSPITDTGASSVPSTYSGGSSAASAESYNYGSNGSSNTAYKPSRHKSKVPFAWGE